MSADARVFLDRWHTIVAERDAEGLSAILAEDIRMGAPPYWSALEGRPVVSRLLEIIIQTIEEFTYHREWIRENELALEFTGRVGEKKLQGVDLISLNADGKIRSLDVMIRPLNALTLLAATVREKIQAAS